MKNNKFAPIIVLVAICIVVSAALAAAYSVANPIRLANEKAAADASRQELIPDADSFTEYTGELLATDDGKVTVTDVYTADNGTGMVVTVSTTSFGGKLVEMIGIDSDGAITGIVISSHSDTPGVGTKAQAESHLSQYIGLTELTATSAKNEATVDNVTGASVSSGAIHYGAYVALQQYAEMGGVQ